MTKRSAIAKIIRPRLSGVLPRPRLFRILNQNRTPVTWVTGPPGSGKTTLVASYLDTRKLSCIWYQIDQGDGDIATFFYYLGLAGDRAAPRVRRPLPLLTPEYRAGITAFTRQYFEDLFGRIKPPFVLALDNYQDIPEDSGLHEIIVNGLSVLPPGVMAIIMSRMEPPPVFARMEANKVMEVIGWEKLQLTAEETRGMMRLRTGKRVSRESLQQIYKKTSGWAAGVVLMEVSQRRGVGQIESDMMVSGKLFDYFAGEIFDRISEETRDFLLKTAYLPQMTAGMAEAISGDSRAAQILAEMNRRNSFIERRTEPEINYQYHALFREFLLSRSKRMFEQEYISQVQRRAAAVLKESGQIEDAIELFSGSGEWNEVASLISQHAPSLLAQGRYRTLKDWLDRLPQAMIEESPDLLYLRGTCLMPFDLRGSRNDFERAFDLYKQQKNPTGLFLSWACFVEVCFFEMNDFKPLDRWITLLEDLLIRYPKFPSEEAEIRVTFAMFLALFYRRPQHPNMKAWVKRMEKLAQKDLDINHKIMIGALLNHYNLVIGDFSKFIIVQDQMRPFLDRQHVTPFHTLCLHVNEAIYNWNFASFDKTFRSVSSGLRLANVTGVHIMDSRLLSAGVYASLTSGNLTTAADYLGKMALYIEHSGRLDVSHYYFLKGFEALLNGNLSAALESVEKSVQLAVEVGTPFPEALGRLGLAQIYLELREYAKAEKQLAHAHHIAYGMKSVILEHLYFLGEAQSAFDQGNEVSTTTFLQKAMVLGREIGYVNYHWWRPSVMTRLCMKALELGIEVEYVQNLIRKRNLIPERPPFEIENWPWALKIHTLGRFGMMKDGRPVTFQGKIQKKPLDLLKALIALGGREVREVQLTDALWPDAAGDAAHSAFSTTLQRLRQLIGSEKAIHLQEGKVTLDARYCWVDAWAFERALNDAESLQDKKPKEAIRLLEKAISLYRGDFLGGDTTQPWAVSTHERLRSKFTRAVARLGRSWEEKGRWEEAARWYLKGLDVNSIAEEFYQGLMRCYHKLGRKAEALSVYERCRKTLSSVLGVEPSPLTESVCRNIKG